MSRQRGYFKHFNDASQGATIAGLFYARRYFEVCLFWVILERCNQLNSAMFTTHINYFVRVLNAGRAKIIRGLTHLSTNGDEISIAFGSDSIEVFVANYAKYQETRGRKAMKKAQEQLAINLPIKDTRLKIEDKRLKIEDNRLRIEDTKLQIQENSPSPLLELWNRVATNLPKIHGLNETRKRKIAALEKQGYSQKDWETLFLTANSTDFLIGKNDRGWRADFDFVLRSATKILEGSYGRVKFSGKDENKMTFCGFSEE
jgi:hypothetical protein